MKFSHFLNCKKDAMFRPLNNTFFAKEYFTVFQIQTFLGQIQLQAFCGSRSVFRQIQGIPKDRAQNSDQFTFLKFENPSTGSNVLSNQSWAFFSKNQNIWLDSILNKPSVLKLIQSKNKETLLISLRLISIFTSP